MLLCGVWEVYSPSRCVIEHERNIPSGPTVSVVGANRVWGRITRDTVNMEVGALNAISVTNESHPSFICSSKGAKEPITMPSAVTAEILPNNLDPGCMMVSVLEEREPSNSILNFTVGTGRYRIH